MNAPYYHPQLQCFPTSTVWQDGTVTPAPGDGGNLLADDQGNLLTDENGNLLSDN